MNAGVLAFDAAGRITTLAVADFPSPHFNGGTPTGDLGSLVLGSLTAARIDGVPYDAAGAVVANSTDAIVAWTGGLPLCADALAVSFDQTPVTWVAGIPLDAAGRVCCASTAPPINLSGFDSGFDGGFG